MDREQVLRVIRLLKSSGATELEVTDNGLRTRVVRARPVGPPEQAAPDAPAKTVEPMKALVEGVLVSSHVVGFFRRAAEDGAEPLAREGQQVQAGNPICAVETLGKLVMIEAPVDGQIIDFMADDGQPVEYGAPLVRIKASERQ